MENMQTPIDEPTQLSPLEFGDEAQTYLRETKQWAKFLAILGFIFVGLIVLGAFAMTAVFPSGGGYGDFPSALIGIIYFLLAVLYFFPVLYLYKFSSHMDKALAGKSPVDLNAAFKNLKSHYRFLGILTIIIIAFYVLAIVFGVIMGMSSMF